MRHTPWIVLLAGYASACARDYVEPRGERGLEQAPGESYAAGDAEFDGEIYRQSYAYPDLGPPGEAPPAEPMEPVGPNRHVSCVEALPERLPPVPPFNAIRGGRPAFDQWRDIECDDFLTRSICRTDADCGSLRCLPLAEDGLGVCTFGDIDIWCDGEGEVMSYGDGGCYTCLPPEHHAAACCEGVEGVDCRAWPFPSDGPPGTPCARHEDCEPGLLCGRGPGSGYGLCQCPEGDLEDPEATCWWRD